MGQAFVLWYSLPMPDEPSDAEAAPAEETEPPDNESRCPHEKDWYCQLLDAPCHPGMKGCILFGQPLIDALLAYEEHVDKKDH